MSAAANDAPGSEVSRVTVISPTRRVDLALPGNAVLGELLPNIVRFSGHEGGTPTEVVHAWILQRLGDDPLDPVRTIVDLGLRDGEILHLRQRDDVLPDVAFDDVVDAVVTATGSRPAWSPADGRGFALATLGVLGVLIPALAAFTTPGLAVPIGVLVLMAACGFTAVLLSRAFGLTAVAGTLAWMTVALAAAGGFALLPAPDPGVGGTPGGGAGRAVQILIATSLVVIAAGAMALGTQVTAYALLGVVVGAAILVGTSMAAVVMPQRALPAAAVALGLVLAATPLIPRLSFAVAGVAMPNLPSTAEGLIADRQPVQHDIVRRAIAAERFQGAFLIGTAVAAGALALGVLSLGRTWAAPVLVLASGLALLLRARSFTGRTARLALLVAGTLLTVLAGLGLVGGLTPPVLRAIVGILVVVIALWLLIFYAARQWNRVGSPVWGRLGDILEWIAIMAIVPLLLAVLDLYSWAYGLAS